MAIYRLIKFWVEHYEADKGGYPAVYINILPQKEALMIYRPIGANLDKIITSNKPASVVE